MSMRIKKLHSDSQVIKLSVIFVVCVH